MVAAVGGSGAALSAGQMESMESSGDMKYMVDHWRGQGTEQHSLCIAAGTTRASQERSTRSMHRLQIPTEDSNMLRGGNTGLKDDGPLGLIRVG